MKKLERTAIEIFKQYGSVLIYTDADEVKALHTEKDIKAAFKKARAGVIERIIDVK